MTIKGVNGENYNVTGSGQGNLNTVLGAIGTFGALGGNLGGILGGNNCGCSENMAVNRYELNMARESDSLKSENALLRSQVYTDQKIVDATRYVDSKVEALAAEVRANKDTQTAINMQQVAYNATATATISCLQNQVAALQGVTQLVIPSSNVCNTGCSCQ